MNVGLLGKFMYVTLLYVHMFCIECDLCSMDVVLHAIYFYYMYAGKENLVHGN